MSATLTSTRVTIIGAGLAGLSCALTLARQGVACMLVCPQPSERAQSVMAEGGINAVLDVMGEHDTLQEHFEETMAGGVWLADPNAVWGMVQEAPDIVRDLISLGVPFQVEHGHLVQRYFGGQKKARTTYAKSSTGKVLVSAMVDAVRRFEAAGLVERLPYREFAGFDFGGHGRAAAGTGEATTGADGAAAGAGADGAAATAGRTAAGAGAVSSNLRCKGVWVRDQRTMQLEYLPAPVVLAVGSMGGMFGPITTGTTPNTGDVAAAAFAGGVAMGNLEMLQYHPTTVPIGGKRMLISEAARGEGGRLFALRNGEPWYFMEELYPELGNLMPRDVVSREEVRVMQDPACTGEVWLDLRHLSKAIWRDRLSDLREEVIHLIGIDPAKEPIPVSPGLHYCMGGVLVDEGHRTNAAGLYAAGECACQYHGANRLGGNSLLGALYGGRVAARSVVADEQAATRSEAGGEPAGVATSETAHVEPTPPAVPEPPAGVIMPSGILTTQCDNAADAQIATILQASMGILRDEASLLDALERLSQVDTTGASPRVDNRLKLAEAIVLSALNRKESRGAHVRVDYPERNDAMQKTSVATCEDGCVKIAMRDIPQLRESMGQAADKPPAGKLAADKPPAGKLAAEKPHAVDQAAEKPLAGKEQS